METYATLDGDVLDLTRLNDAERKFLERCHRAYRDGMAWDVFTLLYHSKDNPVVAAHGGRVNQAVWNHPLFQAVRDLGDRLGIRQGEVGAEPGDDVDRDPFADEWIPTAEAVRRKGVSRMGLHGAITRGDVVAKRLSTRRSVVSARSLERWQPDPARQAARKQATCRTAKPARENTIRGETPKAIETAA